MQRHCKGIASKGITICCCGGAAALDPFVGLGFENIAGIWFEKTPFIPPVITENAASSGDGTAETH